MADPLDPVIKGLAPSLLDTDKANGLLDVARAFRDLEFFPLGSAELHIRGEKAVIEFKDTAGGDETSIVVTVLNSDGSLSARVLTGRFTDTGAYSDE